MQQVANLVLKHQDPHPIGTRISPIVPRCVPARHKPCFSVVFAPVNVPWVRNIMHSIANTSGLNYDTDFYGLGNATDLASWRTDNATMYDFFVANQNVSQVGIIFTGPYVNPFAQGQDISNELGYWFYYNQSMPGPAQSTLLAIEQQISNQLLHRNTSSFAAKQLVFSDEHVATLQGSLHDNAVFDGYEQALRQVEPTLLDSLNGKFKKQDNKKKLSYDAIMSELVQKREKWLEEFSQPQADAKAKSRDQQQAEDLQEAKTLLSSLATAANFSFTITFKDFPETLLRISQLSIANQSGGTLYFIPPMIIFFVLLTDIVAEKETKLRVGMKMMGLSNAAYWASWYTHGLMFVLLVTGIQYLAGLACGYTFFTHSNAFAVLALFWTFGIAMLTVAFFLSTVISSTKTAQTVGYAIILVGFVFQSVLNSLNGLLVDFMWLRGAATWIVAVRYILSSYPPFNLAKAWSDISALSSAIPSFSEGMIVDGPGFHWSDMYKYRVVLDTSKLYVASPPPANSYYTLLINILIFGVLAWYLDNVLPGEHGSPRPFYFLFTREYWGMRKKKKATVQRQHAGGRYAPVDDEAALLQGSINAGEEYDSDVEAEQQVALDGEFGDSENFGSQRTAKPPRSKWAVRLQNISKLYRRWSCCRSDTDTFAVNDVSVTIERGELFTLLGHNGAGKTTLISMLTGLFKPTSGVATIYGLDLEEDAVRSVIGVCPQHDVLWPELTAREHLLLFSRVKGIPSYLIDAEVHDKLELVGLTHVANEPAGSFSGGMKRRLSVAVSCIGDPKLIFLDEPSSGLDPVNKRKIWRMIEGLKRNRAIVLTTHSMEEAEVLSDRLAIMAYGKIRAIGDSLHLKNKYGDGYRISIVVDVPTETPKEASPATFLYNEIASQWPDIRLISNDSGMLLLGCTKTFQEEMPALLDFIMADSRVKEWGLSHSTLESVFLAVTKKHNFVYEEIESDEELPDLPVGDVSSNESYQRASSTKPQEAAPRPTRDSAVDPDMESDSEDGHYRPKPKSAHHHKGHTSHGRKQLSSHPLRALVRKNLTLQWRQRFSTCCQLVTPILIILILFILKVIIQSQLGPNMSAPHVYPGQPIAQNLAANIGAVHGSPANNFFFAYSDPTGNAGTLFVNGTGSGMLGYLPQFNNTWRRLVSGPHVPMTLSPDHPDHPESPNNAVPVAAPESDSPSNPPISNSTEPPETPSWKYHYYGGMMPYFDQYHDETTIQNTIYDNFTDMNKISIKLVKQFPIMLRVPDAYAAFHKVDGEKLKLDVTLSVNTNPVRDYHRENNFTRLEYAPSFFLKPATNLLPRSLNFQNGFWSSMTMMARSFTAWSLGLAGIKVEPYLRAYNTIVTQPMPTWTEDNIWAFLELAGTLLYPLGLTLQIPLYMYLLTLEKSEKLREMMLSHGLRTRYYHFVNYVFFFTIYAITAALFWLAGIASNSRFFISTHWSVLLLFFLGWGFALVSLASFISAFLNSPRVATVAGYVIALFGTSLAFVVAVGIYGPSPLSLNTPYPVWTFIWPQFSFMRGMYLLNDACALQGQCYGPITKLRWGDEFSKALLAIYLAGIIFYILFLYLDAVLPREYGIPKHPLFFLPWFRRSKKNTASSTPRAALHTMSARGSTHSLPRTTADSSALETGDDRQTAGSATGSNGTHAKSAHAPSHARSLLDYDSDYNSDADDNEAVTTPLARSHKQLVPTTFQWDSSANEDVAIEVARVLNGSYPANSPLVCQALRKVYDSGKVAVKGLHLAVAENECFGLLGENGAGKSTTLSMLTGMFSPSDGTALVGGYDIRTEIDQVHLSMGLCPQFDILWNDLTVREHLLFYARLKGIDSGEESEHVDRLIAEVGLSKAKNKRADALSGGMRRRLSIAIALVGDSRIVFLDEPTTGLDAASRRQIWAIVRRAKRGRAIILTTHSMDEAELLCGRIGILAHGQLRCIGNQQHLKSHFGEGVRLKINYGQARTSKTATVQHNEPASLDASDDDEIRFNAKRHASPPPKNDNESRLAVVSFIMQTFPDAAVAGDFHGTIEFLLAASTPISHIFRTMETNAPKNLISDWAVSQIGLEDVFQTVVAQAEQEADAPEPYDAV